MTTPKRPVRMIIESTAGLDCDYVKKQLGLETGFVVLTKSHSTKSLRSLPFKLIISLEWPKQPQPRGKNEPIT